MVRQYLPEREDGLVAWRVPGKRRRASWTYLDDTRRPEGLHDKVRAAKREVEPTETTTKTDDVPAGRKGGGKASGHQDRAELDDAVPDMP